MTIKTSKPVIPGFLTGPDSLDWGDLVEWVRDIDSKAAGYGDIQGERDKLRAQVVELAQREKSHLLEIESLKHTLQAIFKHDKAILERFGRECAWLGAGAVTSDASGG